MNRRELYAIAQISLALEPAANPASESALRAAFRRLDLSRRLTFEQAMSNAAYAIGIRNIAEATARRIRAKSPPSCHRARAAGGHRS